MNICLFLKDEIEKPLLLSDERAKHIINILHKKVGDEFSAGIINETAGIAHITKIADGVLEYKFRATENDKPLLPIKMIVGFPRPIQLKRLFRDVATLGVSEVHLTGTELGEKSYLQSNIIEKGNAQKMLIEGATQAMSVCVPRLFVHQDVASCSSAVIGSCKGNEKSHDLLDETNGDVAFFALDNVRAKTSLKNATRAFLKGEALGKRQIVLAVGSERGWTDNERNIFVQHGFSLCSMGNRVMRTETATTVSLAIVLSECGFFD